MSNLVFIGLPHAGKSLLGKKCSDILKKGFIETDWMIQYKYNAPLKNIIHKRGINGFLNIENDILQTIHSNNSIISTGGSAVYSKPGIFHLRNNLNSEIIHLQLSFDEFKNRINSFHERGIVNPNQLDLEDFYNERIRLCNTYSTHNINVNDKKKGLNELLDFCNR
jgi:shikimate kinase